MDNGLSQSNLSPDMNVSDVPAQWLNLQAPQTSAIESMRVELGNVVSDSEKLKILHSYTQRIGDQVIPDVLNHLDECCGSRKSDLVKYEQLLGDYISQGSLSHVQSYLERHVIAVKGKACWSERMDPNLRALIVIKALKGEYFEACLPLIRTMAEFERQWFSDQTSLGKYPNTSVMSQLVGYTENHFRDHEKVPQQYAEDFLRIMGVLASLGPVPPPHTRSGLCNLCAAKIDEIDLNAMVISLAVACTPNDTTSSEAEAAPNQVSVPVTYLPQFIREIRDTQELNKRKAQSREPEKPGMLQKGIRFFTGAKAT